MKSILEQLREDCSNRLQEYLGGVKDNLHTNNGPYKKNETLLRAVSHELVFWSKSSEIDWERVQYILKAFLQEGNKQDWIIHHESGDITNGVIGGAWVIEGLVGAFKLTKDTSYLKIAESLYFRHKFNKRVSLWHRPDGGRIDETLNHQVWFAYAAMLLAIEIKSDKIHNLSKSFLRNLESKLVLHKNGIVHHRSLKRFTVLGRCKQKLRSVISEYSLHDINLVYKSIGYFPFLVLPLAHMVHFYPENSFFSGSKWKTITKFFEYEDNLQLLFCPNVYGTGYNLSIFETVKILHLLDIKISSLPIDKQHSVIENSKQDKLFFNLLLLKTYEIF